MADQAYTLRFKNRSNSQHDFLLYQRGIDGNTPGVYTLAWFAKPVANGADVDVSWTLDYSFVWSQQGTLMPQINFHEGQVLPANLTDKNLVHFTRIDGAFQFGKQSGGGAQGSLTIDADSTIPKNTAKIGIGMSGNATHVVDAEPNFAAVFSVHPEYWISFGSFQPGQVLDTQTMVNSDKVEFPVNVFNMTATLDSGNDWMIAQGLS